MGGNSPHWSQSHFGVGRGKVRIWPFDKVEREERGEGESRVREGGAGRYVGRGEHMEVVGLAAVGENSAVMGQMVE